MSPRNRAWCRPSRRPTPAGGCPAGADPVRFAPGRRRGPGPERTATAKPRIYTKKGDDGTTGLLYGGRTRKDAPAIEVNGAVDEAQAALGLARAEAGGAGAGAELDGILVGLERDLWVLMAEVATQPRNRHKLAAGATLVTAGMVAGLEDRIDAILARFDLPAEFVVPGQDKVSALLDVARTVVRRAERLALSLPDLPEGEASLVVPYLNRLSDLCWALARWQEGEHLLARQPAGGP
ncbi:MAG: cob(I)yrinic acid a,c-diamide adenosyltransferase [Acidimicrobiales bacterium]